MKKIKTGFAQVGYFEITEIDGKDTYGPVIDFYGTREYSAEPQGEPLEVYANCELAYSQEVNDGYLINLTMLKFIDSVSAAWLGDVIDEINKTRAEYKDQEKPRFGLVLRDLTTDGLGEIWWYYNCKANERPNSSGKTRESNIEAQFESMVIKAIARADGLVRFKTTGNSIPAVVPTVSLLKNLTVTSEEGVEAGKTQISILPVLTSGNTYMYKTAATVDIPDYDDDLATWTAWNGSDEITATTGNEIVIAEVDSSTKAKAAGKTTVVSNDA